MSVPEAAMYKDYGSIFREYDVGSAWEVPALKSKAKTQFVQGLSHLLLGCGVSGWNPSHSLGTLGWGEKI
jgi:hypothetical protein